MKEKMEEAEVLCSRIGIMRKAKLHSIGTPMELKQKFGLGYNIKLSHFINCEEKAHKYVHFLFVINCCLLLMCGIALLCKSSPTLRLCKLLEVKRKRIKDKEEKKRIKEWKGKEKRKEFNHFITDLRAYKVIQGDFVLSELFKTMERSKHRYGIKEWSISQAR